MVKPKSNLLPLTDDVLSMFKGVVWECIAPGAYKKKKRKDGLLVECFYVSAVAKDAVTNGLAELREFLHAASIPGEWDVDDYEQEDRVTGPSSSSVYDNVNTELDDETFAAECIREKIFTYVHQEVPYGVTQVNRLWEYDGRRLKIQSDLVVKTRTQKKMVIGPKGEILGLIAQSAERDLSEHFGIPVELTLWVREKGKNKA